MVASQPADGLALGRCLTVLYLYTVFFANRQRPCIQLPEGIGHVGTRTVAIDPSLRILPDTNVWLEAAFCRRDDLAYRALVAGSAASLLLDEMIKLEAEKVLRFKRLSLGLNYDPLPIFARFVAETKCLQVPPAPVISVSGINKPDRHVVRSATHYNAFVLTSDAELVYECRCSGIRAEFPWALLTTLQDPPTPSMNEVLRLVRPEGHKGTIFARLPTFRTARVRFARIVRTVADLENVGRLFFDENFAGWVFECCTGVSVSLKWPEGGDEDAVICASYDLPGRGREGKLQLRASRGGNRTPTETTRTLVSLRAPCGRIQIGSSLAGADHWNGTLRQVTIGPWGIPISTWRAITKLDDAAPNPGNHDILDNALRQRII